VLRGETPTLYFLGFNVEQAPYDDPEVRRAISLAIDREAIVETVGEGVALADSLLGGGLPNGAAGACEACVHDPATARAIFAERGIERLRLSFNRDGGHLPVARRIRSDLAEVGVVLEFQAQATDLGAYLAELADGDAGMFRYGWSPEHPVADELLHPLFHSSQIGVRNYMRYDAVDVDALIDAARASPGALRRVFLSRRAEDLILNRDQVIVPILRYRNLQVVDERVQGYRLDAMGRANLAETSL
jgi:peptide/nickel transport system substrate-binding protein/oligopeptide transport system substrate-binding protein